MSGGNGNSDDGLWMLFFIVVMILAAGWGIWYLFKPQLLQTYIWVRQGEMAVASYWTDPNERISYIHDEEQKSITFGQAKKLINEVTPKQLLRDDVDEWAIIHATTRVALEPMKVPFGILFGLMIYYALFMGPTSYHRKKFNLDGLIAAQSKTFPILLPIVKFNPLKGPSRAPGDAVPAVLPMFAEALGPEEWLAFHKNPVIDGKIDVDAAEQAFILQLGDKWQGAKKLPKHQQALLAAFALKAARKRTEADDLLGRIAGCWDHQSGLKLSRDKGLMTDVRRVLRDKSIGEPMITRCNHHAFVTTALIGALDYARSEGGVLAPAQFLWLRGHDRNLWYPLNNLGRQAYHAEAMGAMSHYRAEKQVKRPIPKPMMHDAIKAITAHMESKAAKPIPQVDYSMVKNKKAPEKNTGVLKPAGT